jgi:predicted metal-dependent enzyme (double-stranded beta helix superfamily)
MLKKLMQRLGRYRVIMDRQDNEPYLERYYLFLKDRQRFPFNVFLHKFLKGDPDDVHDHPWPYCTVILKGGYYEWVPQFDSQGRKTCEVRHWRGPGHFRRCSANSYHRIELKPGVTAWTLFMPGPQQQDWGFWFNNAWVQHEDYFKLKKLLKGKD